MRFLRITKRTTRPLLALTLALALTSLAPAPAQAAPNPVDLELGGEGATPWVIGGIKPGDSGTKTVELRNVGTADGYVTIWFDEIVSGEGLNPESETGDTSEPGELADYLEFNVTAAGLGTNLSLPATINDLPHSFASSDYIEVIPLRAGETVDLEWQWELPWDTGNVVQGDSITFTTTYLLQEIDIVDLSGVVSAEGEFTEEFESESGGVALTIGAGTIALTASGDPVTEIWIAEADKEPSAPSPDTATVGSQTVLGPPGATFNPPITVALTYDPADIPLEADPGDLFFALWDEGAGEWTEVEGSTVDAASNIVSAPISHFSRYTILARIPAPVIFPEPGGPPGIIPGPDEPEDVDDTPVGPARFIEIDLLGQSFSVGIDADGALIEPLTVTDGSRDFTIDLAGGTVITSPGGVELSRIELSIDAGDSVADLAIPDDLAVLSPVYRVTGYGGDELVGRIDFAPAARLSIRYDPNALPEYVFLPYVARYDDVSGSQQLPPAPGIVEVGIATGLTDHASLFVVLAELVPPPPDLPEEFEVTAVTIEPVTPILEAGDLALASREIQAGETANVSVTVTNRSSVEGTIELYLVIDGVVRMVREVTLPAETSQVVTFEVHDLAAGTHQVKVAGLTEQFEVVAAGAPPIEAGVNWPLIDLSVAAAILGGAFFLYRFTRRARRV